MDPLDQHATAVANADATYQEAVVALNTRDGLPLYSPPEMERREKEARDAHAATFREAEEAVRAAIQEARRALARTDADPLPRLDTAVIARVSAMMPLVAEDFAALPLAAVAERVEDARTLDEATRYCYLRCAVKRIERERERDGERGDAMMPPHLRGVIGKGMLTPEGERLRVAVEALAATFTSSADTRRRAEAEARIEKANTLASELAYAKTMRTNYGWRR